MGQAISWRAFDTGQFRSNNFTMQIREAPPFTTNTAAANSYKTTNNISFDGTVYVGTLIPTNIIYIVKTPTLFITNAPMYTNMSLLTMTNDVWFTNWATVASAGNSGNTTITNATAVNYYVHVPTNLMSMNMTNRTGSYVAFDFTGTNWSCIVTAGAVGDLAWKFVGNNLNAGRAYFLHK